MALVKMSALLSKMKVLTFPFRKVSDWIRLRKMAGQNGDAVKKCCKMRSSRVMVFCGFFFFTTFAYLGFGGLNSVIRSIIASNVALRSGTFAWDTWRTMPIDIHMRFRMFNITNPDGVYRGEKPIVNEMGPYVFLEDWEKVDLSENAEDNTIRFRMTRTYYFQPHLSNGSIDDQVTFINAIFISVATMTSNLLHNQFLTWQMDDILADRGENITKTATVREILFEGISIQPYIDLFNNPLIQSEVKKTGMKLPENILDGKFALLKGRNGSDEGWFEVKNGVENAYETGQVVKHNGAPLLSTWRDASCNQIRGSDATFFPPFVTKEQVTYLYIAAMCRSIELNYVSPSKVKGVDTYKFVISLRNWMSPDSNPANWCYCPADPTEFVNDTCYTDGVFNLGPCLFGAPIVLSQPHFYGADDWVQDGVIGLNPDYDKHMTTVHFHPLTGAPVEGYARVQFNVDLIPFEEMPTFSDARHAIVPLGWMETGAVMEDKHTRLLIGLDYFLWIFGYTTFIFMSFGLYYFAKGMILIQTEAPKVPVAQVSQVTKVLQNKSVVKVANW